MFNYLYLGRIPYRAANELQQLLVELRHQQKIENTLLLLEHPPTLTLGRNSHRSNVLASDELLQKRGILLEEINRGGDVTYHGPGQLVGYPIIDLRSFTPRLGAVDYVRLLEETLIRVCASYGVLTTRVKGRTGVWTQTTPDRLERKVAAIGVHVSRGITSHGFAMNVTTDLRDFQLIVPCGISDREVTSLEVELGGNPDLHGKLQEVANETARQFGMVFGGQILALDSLKDLIGTTHTALRDAMLDKQEPESGIIPNDTPLRIPRDLQSVRGEPDRHLA